MSLRKVLVLEDQFILILVLLLVVVLQVLVLGPQVPIAPFAGGCNMQVAVLTMHSSSCTAVWCGLGKYYVSQKP